MPEIIDPNVPDLPADWGVVAVVCDDNEHRFLPGGLKCGCGEKVNLTVFHQQLHDTVVQAAKDWHHFSCSTLPENSKEQAQNILHDAVEQLEKFESLYP